MKTLLASPSDIHANAETPFFKRLSQGFGPFEAIGKRLIAPVFATVEACLSEAGVAPPNIVVETIYAATVCALVANGVGLGLVSPYAVAGLDASRLVLRPFEPAVQSKSLLILPLDRPKSQLVRDFIDCLMAAR